MKCAFFTILFILFTINFSFSNEKKINYSEEANFDQLTLQNNMEDVNYVNEDVFYDLNDYFVFNFNSIQLEKYVAKKKPNKNEALYKKHRRIGIGLLVPGIILFASSFFLMAPGIVLTVWSETGSSRSYSYNYYYEYYGTQGNMYSTDYYTYYPYQSIGIPLIGVGGLFFCVGLPLLIAGAVNLSKSKRYKTGSLLHNKFALNLNYNPFDNNLYFNAKFSF